MNTKFVKIFFTFDNVQLFFFFFQICQVTVKAINKEVNAALRTIPGVVNTIVNHMAIARVNEV